MLWVLLDVSFLYSDGEGKFNPVGFVWFRIDDW